MDLIQTIVLLCQLNVNSSDSLKVVEYTQKEQLKCQQYYVRCLESNFLGDYKNLSKCILQRKL